MTPDELDDWLERARTESASIVAPAGFTDRVLQRTHGTRRWNTPEFAGIAASAVSSGALVAAGMAIWMSLGDGPLDAASLPIAVAGVAVAMGGLAWMWFDDSGGADLRIRLSDLRPY